MIINNLEPQNYKRFFAFGCSCTNYFWPTWADIIGQDIEIYENWGYPGAGNHFIFNSIVEANARHKFNDKDLVIIMWSGFDREDRYAENAWKHWNPYTVGEDHSKQWIAKYYVDFRGQLIRNLTYIKAAQVLVEASNTNWTNLMLWTNLMCHTSDRELTELLEKNADVMKLYNDAFLNIKGSWRRFVEQCPKYNRIGTNIHSPPKEALDFIDWVWPKNTLSTKARNYAMEWEPRAHNGERKTLESVNRL